MMFFLYIQYHYHTNKLPVYHNMSPTHLEASPRHDYKPLEYQPPRSDTRIGGQQQLQLTRLKPEVCFFFFHIYSESTNG